MGLERAAERQAAQGPAEPEAGVQLPEVPAELELKRKRAVGPVAARDRDPRPRLVDGSRAFRYGPG